MGDNNLLLALSLMERVKPQLKEEKREQINRAGLTLINQMLTQALDCIIKTCRDSGNAYIIGYLIGVTNIVSALLQDESYIETDTETKELLAEKVNECMSRIYLEVGKYYTTHDFVYSVKLCPLLNRVIDTCIEQGYYFGVDEKIKEESTC